MPERPDLNDDVLSEAPRSSSYEKPRPRIVDTPSARKKPALTDMHEIFSAGPSPVRLASP